MCAETLNIFIDRHVLHNAVEQFFCVQSTVSADLFLAAYTTRIQQVAADSCFSPARITCDALTGLAFFSRGYNNLIVDVTV